jgi:hypothetical protein
VAGEHLRASCSKLTRASFDDEPLGNVDCSFSRLSRVLRARAGELSASLVYGKRCRARGADRVRLECSATIARPSQRVALESAERSDAGPAPSPEQVLDLDDPRPQDQDQIQVGFKPSAPSLRARARGYAAVDETSVPSVGRGTLGQVSARCDACETSQLRFALRATAGRVGAGEVSGVSCFQDAAGLRCVATALAPWSF